MITTQLKKAKNKWALCSWLLININKVVCPGPWRTLNASLGACGGDGCVRKAAQPCYPATFPLFLEVISDYVLERVGFPGLGEFSITDTHSTQGNLDSGSQAGLAPPGHERTDQKQSSNPMIGRNPLSRSLPLVSQFLFIPVQQPLTLPLK